MHYLGGNAVKYSKFDAVRNLVEGALSAVNDDITYIDGQTPPTDKEIDAELKRIQDEYDHGYFRKRASEYPSIGDQLDMIYKDMKNGTTTHAEAVEAVKTKYPKG